MSYNIEEITKEKFSKFGEFINPEEVQSTNINLNTTKFYSNAIFNDRNTSASKSFDDIINSRRFNAVIYKEENVYENRYIRDYIPNNAFMRLLESERIREKIRNFEHDMWSW